MTCIPSTTTAALAVAAGLVATWPTAAAATDGPAAEMRLDAAAVVTSVHVPPAADPVYVSRSYDYDLYGTCWSKNGRPRLDMVQLMGSASVPSGAGGYQMRLPDDTRTSFTFTDAAGMLAHPASATRPVVCPKNLVAAPYRASIGQWKVSVLHHGSSEQVLTGNDHLELFFTAP